jgi:hypothetical protein
MKTPPKKYTIGYIECRQIVGHRSIVKYDRVETDNLKELLESYKHSTNTSFIFEGWPKVEGE